jgi:hypothetical protein
VSLTIIKRIAYSDDHEHLTTPQWFLMVVGLLLLLLPCRTNHALLDPRYWKGCPLQIPLCKPFPVQKEKCTKHLPFGFNAKRGLLLSFGVSVQLIINTVGLLGKDMAALYVIDKWM